MRKGNDSMVAYGRDGLIAGVALGADFVSEHEWGIADLRRSFCSKAFTEGDLGNRLDQSGQIPEFSSKERDAMDQNLNQIKLVEDAGFVTITTRHDEFTSPIRHRIGVDKMQSEFTFHKQDVEKARGQLATEWDGRNFRFCNALFGDEKLMKKLRKFHEQLQAGQGSFYSVHCGLWDQRAGKVASGLVIVDRSRLSYAQTNHWRVIDGEILNRLTLRKLSRLDVILQRTRKGELSKDGHCDIGYFWPEWEYKKTKANVVYGFNPGYNIKADYFGPYTEGQITRWLDHNMKYRLTRESEEKEVAA